MSLSIELLICALYVIGFFGFCFSRYLLAQGDYSQKRRQRRKKARRNRIKARSIRNAQHVKRSFS